MKTVKAEKNALLHCYIVKLLKIFKPGETGKTGKAGFTKPILIFGYTPPDAAEMIKPPNCDAVMIGRAGYGNPCPDQRPPHA